MKGIKKIYFDKAYNLWRVIFTDGCITAKTKKEAITKATKLYG